MTIISRTTFVFDIDTTIANNDHRALLLNKSCVLCGTPCTGEIDAHCPSCGTGRENIKIPQDCWDRFLAPDLIMLDTVEPDALRVVNRLRELEMDFHFVTGRNEGLREVTEAWLALYFGWRGKEGRTEQLYMRPNDGSKGIPASVMKERLLHQLMDKNRLNPAIDRFVFFEDDPYVFAMYEKYGVVVKCPEGFKYWCPPTEDRSGEPAWRR